MIGQMWIHYEGLPLNAPGVAKRELNSITRGAWFLTGVHWHRHMRLKHFTRAGAAEYGYAKRQGDVGGPDPRTYTSRAGHQFRYRSYTRAKLNKFGHTDPLRYTSETYHRTFLMDVRATAQKVRIVMHVPAYFHGNAYSQRIDVRDELSRVSKAEEAELIKLHERLIIRGIQQNRARSSVQIAA